jgi:hypothetical protein
MNGDNLNNVKCEASRHFKNKQREYLKDKINELALNSKICQSRVLQLLVTDNVPSLPTVTLMMEVIRSSETSVLRATSDNNPEDDILKKPPWSLVRNLTIPIVWPPLVDEDSTKF